ncbi:MAG: DNA mismatch repair protein MutS, partial [Verrucomicrobiota bacterium]|nr:DNA mismatch repair protein MutS [Verrucomicrobiota bacterium]
VDSRSGRQHTLLGVLDRTTTPMGARKLRDWILHPISDRDALEARHDLIGSFLAESFLLTHCRESLKEIRDIERCTGRLAQGSGNPRDLQALQTSLSQIPSLRADLDALPSQQPEICHLKTEILQQLHEFPELVELLENALVDEPPVSPREGGLMRDGFSTELDELRSASRDGKEWIAQMQQSERKRTGIDSLKIKFNNVFGYFIEVTKANLSKVPEDYQRKQTMANAERYITPGLKEVESKVLGADERAKQLEYEEFLKLRSEITCHLDELQQCANGLATLDVLLGLAETAQLYQHTRPVLDDSRDLEIVNGRHPVLEQTLVEEKFVPNDSRLLHA